MWRAPDTKICYKPLASNDTSITSAYPSDRPWKGPCVLVRQGPPYRADGELDTASDPIVQVLVDNLVACGTMADAMDIKVTNVGACPTNSFCISRDVDVTIKQIDENNQVTPTSFSARIASNPLYAANDMYDSTFGCSAATVNMCYDGPNSKHFRPRLITSGNFSNPSVEGDPNKENVFYFESRADDYTLWDTLGNNKPCSYEGCQVWLKGTFQHANLANVDVLVFADRDLRPGPRATGP